MLGLNTRTRTSSSHIEEGMTTVAHPPKKGYRTIRLPLAESEYDHFLTDRSYAEDRLEELYEEFAELFPDAFPWGYTFFGFTEPSIKQQLLCRRIRLELSLPPSRKRATKCRKQRNPVSWCRHYSHSIILVGLW
jgi:hypothetical protein